MDGGASLGLIEWGREDEGVGCGMWDDPRVSVGHVRRGWAEKGPLKKGFLLRVCPAARLLPPPVRLSDSLSGWLGGPGCVLSPPRGAGRGAPVRDRTGAEDDGSAGRIPTAGGRELP